MVNQVFAHHEIQEKEAPEEEGRYKGKCIHKGQRAIGRAEQNGRKQQRQSVLIITITA